MPRDVNKLEEWIKAHPVKANIYALGIAVLFFEVMMILDQLLRLHFRSFK